MARLFRSLTEIPADIEACAVTIGNFDGVHIGHQKIMRRVVEHAHAHGLKASVLTFDPHPTKVVAPARAPKLLSTTEQRVAQMERQGIEQVFVIPFDSMFSKLTAQDFLHDILVGKLKARAVFIGENFRFGNKQAGDTRMLTEAGERLGFVTEVVSPVQFRNRTVSSSEVRKAVGSGDVSLACRMLGRPYALEGAVVSGHGVGSKQTVPTLNLDTKAEVLPANGVYVTRTEDLDDGRKWPSVTNIGRRPTFNGDALTIETFLLGPLEGGTPRQIRVEFLKRLRDERKFDSPEALKAQILRDVGRAQKYLRRSSGLY
jgi:riboflavin kinase/FMN adenylyltransferase